MKQTASVVNICLFLGLGCFAFGEEGVPEKPGDGPKDQPGPVITIGTSLIPGTTSTSSGVTNNADGSFTIVSVTQNVDGSTTTTITTVYPNGSSTSTSSTTAPTICTKNGQAFYDNNALFIGCFGNGDECTYTGTCTEE